LQRNQLAPTALRLNRATSEAAGQGTLQSYGCHDEGRDCGRSAAMVTMYWGALAVVYVIHSPIQITARR
jgi:hypothetical protein